MNNNINNLDFEKDYCVRCNNEYPNYHLMNYTKDDKSSTICFTCWNQECADALGIPLAEMSHEPVKILDKKGKPHYFHIKRFVYSTGILLEACELQKNMIKGYVFGSRGEIDCDQMELYLNLINKIKRCLQKEYITTDEDGHKSFNNDEAIGNITWDDETDGELPLLMIDGKEYTWHEIGRMMMTYEGFKFKLQIFDRTDDFE